MRSLMENKILKKLVEKHIGAMKNLNLPNKKIIVSFSAVPGAGKSYISQRISNHFHAVRINNDQIREILTMEGIQSLAEKQAILGVYIQLLLDHRPYENKFLVLDAGLDRNYMTLATQLQKLGWPLCLIRVSVNREVIEERLKTRENAQYFLDRIDKFQQDFDHSIAKEKAQITLTNPTDQDIDHMMEQLSQYIKKL